MSEPCERIVVPCRGRDFAKSVRPFSAIGPGDPPAFSICQACPAVEQCSKNLVPVVSRGGFNRNVVGLVLLAYFERLAECHFRGHFGVSVSQPLAMFFEESGELGLSYAVMRCRERFPNFFAASKGSGIVAPRLMAKEIRLSGITP